MKRAVVNLLHKLVSPANSCAHGLEQRVGQAGSVALRSARNHAAQAPFVDGGASGPAIATAAAPLIPPVALGQPATVCAPASRPTAADSAPQRAMATGTESASGSKKKVRPYNFFVSEHTKNMSAERKSQLAHIRCVRAAPVPVPAP